MRKIRQHLSHGLSRGGERSIGWHQPSIAAESKTCELNSKPRICRDGIGETRPRGYHVNTYYIGGDVPLCPARGCGLPNKVPFVAAVSTNNGGFRMFVRLSPIFSCTSKAKCVLGSPEPDSRTQCAHRRFDRVIDAAPSRVT